jgi:membrane fusion protein, multidrug efflux system
MSMSRRVAVISGALALVVVAAGAFVYVHVSAGAAAADGGEGQAGLSAAVSAFATDVAIAVEAADVVRGDLVLSVTAAGQAEAWRRTRLTAEVAGRVLQVPVRESERAGAGALVLALDPVDYELALEEAEARRARVEADYRERTLFDHTLDPDVRTERERAARIRSGLDEAELALRKARLDLERTRVRAPFAGRIASLNAVPGQLVRQGDELMTLVDLDPIRVHVQVLEGELAHLTPGARARVTFSAFPDQGFGGTVETINPIVEEQTRTARVTVLVPNRGGLVLPGMYARVEVEAQRVPDRILVPRSAILERDRRTMLFVYEDGRAKWRYVTTGLENEHYVEVREHPDTDIVHPGEVVLTAGHFTLTHDAAVRLVDSHRTTEAGRPE